MTEVALTLSFITYVFIGVSFVIKVIDENLIYTCPSNKRFLVWFLCVVFLPILIVMLSILYIIDYINEVLKWLSK